jgi:hypothetical protein
VSLGYVTKENGAEIELGLFTDDRMRHVSAVIFSCTATWGKINALAPETPGRHVLIQSTWGSEPNGRPVPRVGKPSDIGETITDGLQVYHNPHAIRPLDPAVFRRKGVVQEYVDAATGRWMVEETTRSLFFRLTHNLNATDSLPDNERKDA